MSGSFGFPCALSVSHPCFRSGTRSRANSSYNIGGGHREVDGIHQPTYTVQYAQPPFTDCGSGNPHSVPGNAWLTIKMTPAQGHGAGQATLPRETSYRCANLRHLSITCDFEAGLTFVIGVNAKKPYRVIELQNPTRLVVDIKH